MQVLKLGCKESCVIPTTIVCGRLGKSKRMARITLERDGRRNDLQLNQITVENVRRIFQVSPVVVWLRDAIDDSAYFPEANGTFDMENISSLATLIVEGPASTQTTPRSTNLPRSVTISSTLSSSGRYSSSLPPPSFRSVIAPRKSPTFRLKIVKAKVTRSKGRRPILQPIAQTYVE